MFNSFLLFYILWRGYFGVGRIFYFSLFSHLGLPVSALVRQGDIPHSPSILILGSKGYWKEYGTLESDNPGFELLFFLPTFLGIDLTSLKY